MNMYDRIRELRIEKGMTQDDLAKAMGYKDRSMITKIEAGKVDISQKKILQFANVLGTTEAFLMGWEEEAQQEQEELPKNDDIRFLIRNLNKLPPEKVKQAKNVFMAMFAITDPDLFDNKKRR